MKLRLKQIAYDSVHFTVNSHFDQQNFSGRMSAPLAHDFEQADLKVSVLVSELSRSILETEDEQYTPMDIEVRFTGGPKTESSFPFQFHIQMSALVVLADPERHTDEERQEYAELEGPRYLIGPMRELLLSLSSRSYFGPIVLPELNIGKIVKRAKMEALERAADEKSQPEGAE